MKINQSQKLKIARWRVDEGIPVRSSFSSSSVVEAEVEVLPGFEEEPVLAGVLLEES